jgi:hypothetical protein
MYTNWVVTIFAGVNVGQFLKQVKGEYDVIKYKEWNKRQSNLTEYWYIEKE